MQVFDRQILEISDTNETLIFTVTPYIAHRGAHIGIPENSLPAIEKAIDFQLF